MKTQTREKIIAFVERGSSVTPKAIIEHLGLVPTAIYRQLSTLVRDGVLQKSGTPPKVFYSLVRSSPQQKTYIFEPSVEQLINERFVKVSALGVVQVGIQAFVPWCLARKLDPVKTSVEYGESLARFDAYKRGDVIDATKKMQTTFPNTALNSVFYRDFYTIERFGKTKLGELMLYAKQSQNISLIKTIVADVASPIADLITRFDIDAVGFVPPTVKRTVQFIKEFERLLALHIPSIKITKIRTPIMVPQKTLSKLEERVENAQRSIVVEETKIYKNILLIDDAIGSGATINEVASQVRAKGLCTGKIIGLALVGSANGFEVIHEV